MNDCTIHEIENIIQDFRFVFDWLDNLLCVSVGRCFELFSAQENSFVNFS